MLPVCAWWPCRKDWTLLRDDSIFVDWQRLKVQENVEEVCQEARRWEAARARCLSGVIPLSLVRPPSHIPASSPQHLVT